MRLFKWTSRNAMYVPQLDDEHKAAFRLAEELRQAIAKGAGSIEIHTRLEALVAHFGQHFAHEERLMRAMNCPFFNWHKGQHDTVRKRIAQFVPDIDEADPAGIEMLLEFLSVWLQDHTLLSDRMLGSYLRNHERAQVQTPS